MLERFWESKEKLMERFKALGNEISNLRAKLNDVNDKKEHWFAKKEELKKQLQESIKKIKDVRLKNDNVNVDIQKLKQERNEYNKIVGELISKVKQLNNERAEMYKKSNLRINPSSIKDRIDGIETKIETEVMSFSKEQKLMKQIKNLKGQYNEMNVIVKMAEHIRQLSAEIENAKAKAQDLHRKIQEYAKKDEEGYGEFIESSKGIINLRQEQENAFRNFVKLKRLYIVVNNTLKTRLVECNKLRLRLDKLNTTVKSKDDELAMLKEKLKFVEDKLRKGEKLTTEDILLFQKGAEQQ